MNSTSLEAPEQRELPEGLEQYPGFGSAVLNYQTDFEDYLAQLRQEVTSGAPEGYLDVDGGFSESMAAMPHLAIALFLKRRDVPIAITEGQAVRDKLELASEDKPENMFTIWIAPEVEVAYQKLWHKIFGEDSRQLANAMATGSISQYDAFPSNFHVVPLVNRDILWAHSQGILQRAYITSELTKYRMNGADSNQLGSVHDSAPLVESLITEQDVKPFALETVLGMGIISAVAALAKHPELADNLHLDRTEIPSVDLNKLDLTKDDFLKAYDSYWKPLLDSLTEQHPS